MLNGVSTTAPDGREISILQWKLDKIGVHSWESLGGMADFIGILFFAGLCFLLRRGAAEVGGVSFVKTGSVCSRFSSDFLQAYAGDGRAASGEIKCNSSRSAMQS